MLLDNACGLLNLLGFKCNNFKSLFQAESEFKNSNFEHISSTLVNKNSKWSKLFVQKVYINAQCMLADSVYYQFYSLNL